MEYIVTLLTKCLICKKHFNPWLDKTRYVHYKDFEEQKLKVHESCLVDCLFEDK